MTPEERAAREGPDDVVHVLLPNMAYACGGNILTKNGSSVCGVGGWTKVTCADCRAYGYDYLRAIQTWMQGHGDHPDDPQLVAPEHHTVAASEEAALW